MATGKRTYGGRRGACGVTTLDYRDILQSIDNSSTVFDALSIKNLKILRKNTTPTYATWSNQPRQSARKQRKRLIRKICKKIDIMKVIETDKPENRTETCLTPNKSLHVNKTPDLFDLLCAQSPKRIQKKQNNVFDQLQSENQENVWSCKDFIKNNPKINLTPDESIYGFESSKENDINGSNNINEKSSNSKNNINLQSSDMNSYELKIEPLKKKEEDFNDSLKNVLSNATFLKQLVKSKSPEIKQNTSESCIRSSQKKSKNLLTSTPYLKKQNKKYSMNMSPIIGQSNFSIPRLHVDENEIENSDGPKFEESLENKCMKNKLDRVLEKSLPNFDPFDEKEVSTSKNYSEMSQRLEIESDAEIKNQVNESTNTGSFSADKCNRRTIQNLNNSDLLTSRESVPETEGFLGFSDVPEPLGIIGEIYVKELTDEEALSSKISQVILNKSHQDDYDSSQSDRSTDSYETCSSQHDSENGKEPSEKIEPRVFIEKMNDSLFNNYFEKMTLFNNSNSSTEMSTRESSESSNVSNTHTNNVSESVSFHSNQNNSLFDQCEQKNVKDDEYRASISISSDSILTETDSQSCTSESSSQASSITLKKDIIRDNKDDHVSSFITMRRGNDFINDSVFIIDDSTESEPDTEKTILKRDCSENKYIKGINVNDKTDVKTENDASIDKQAPLENYDVPSSSSEDADQIVRPSIVLLPGKKWERSLSVYRRQTLLQNQNMQGNINCYRESLYCDGDKTRGSMFFNQPVPDERKTLLRYPRKSTIKIVRESCGGRRSSISALTIFENEIGFLSEDCDDTVCTLSRLSLSDSLDGTVVETRTLLDKSPDDAARDLLLRRCNQRDILPFHECYPDSVLKNCHKIGEGVYGEVYLYKGQDGRGRVMKVVPVNGTDLVNGEPQKTYQEVISEVLIAMELSALRAPICNIDQHCDEEGEGVLDLSAVENATDAFNEVLGVKLVQGPYPERLLDLWELYHETRGSENDSPDSLPAHQQFLVLELANAGLDLEGFQFNNARQAHALLYQIAYALAVAEEAFQFEHRDLHWGNILIQPTEQKFAHFVLRGRVHRVERHGVAGTVIDYTLSRLSLGLPGGELATLYNDLAHDAGLFQATGDYQFLVYRLMKEKTGNDWKKFEPFTNILWLHYVIDKMITALRYKRTNTKIHKHYIAKLKEIKNRILNYPSVVDFVLSDNAD